MSSPPQRGIQSLEKGVRLLKILARQRQAMPLSAIASAASMPASIVHRYLVSFIREGVVEQTDEGFYDLGGFVLTAGLSKLSRLDSYRVGLSHLESLSRESGETALMAAWNGHSLVAIRWIEADRPINVYVRPGSLLPLVSSASGRIFASFLPPRVAMAAIEREFQSGLIPTVDGRKLERREFQELIEATRRRGMARVRGDFSPGIDALAVPVFDHQQNIIFSFSLLGHSGALDAEWMSPVARILQDTAVRCSRALGASLPASDLESSSRERHVKETVSPPHVAKRPRKRHVPLAGGRPRK